MVSRNRKIARRIGQAVANDVLDISGAISAGAGVTVYATADDLPTTGLTAGDEAFVSGSNRLYISNGTGWYSIGLVNTNPAITSVEDPSSNTTPFTLATDGSALVLTITAADPEDIPLTYSYAVTTGSLTNGGGTTATVVQGTGANTNQFTITPTTTEAYAGTFDLTFTASDGINQASSVNSFTLNFITTIANSNYTTLLATATGTSDNNNITDASTNNHSITVAGDAYAGTFSPFRWNGASQYYDGSSYQVYGSWSDITGLSNVTIECWIYKTSHTNSYHSIMATRASGSNSAGFDMRFPQNSGVLTVYYTGGAGVTSTTNMNLNTWYHVMFVRDGSTGTLYIDGVQEDQDTWGDRPGLSNLYVGTYARGTVLLDGCINGYISDLRISNISRTAEVPTTPINVDSNTLFYIAGKHGPYDTSSSSYSPSFTGLSGANLTKSTYGPYEAPNSGYTTTDHGGSVYFDGNGDYLLINNPPTLGANDWTFETWYYAANPLTYNSLLSQGAGNNTLVSNFTISTTGQIFIQTHTTTNVVLYNTAAGIIKGYTWNHIVLTHDYDGSSGGTYKIYVNGNQVGNVSYTSGYYWNSGGISSTPLAMAQYRYSNQVNGACYFSDWKISNSVTYSSNFTPPTAPLSSSGAELHIKGTDASIIDKSQRYNIDLGSTSIVGDSTTKWSGANSIYINSKASSSDLITIPAGVLDASKPFTIEMWLKTLSGSVSGFWSIYQDASNTMILKMRGDDRLEFYHRGSGASGQEIKDETNTYTLNNTDFYHVAITRDANSVFYLHQNGIKLGNFTANGNYNSLNTPFIIGKSQPATERYMTGYIQDFRISQGQARYTAADETANIPSAPLEG